MVLPPDPLNCARNFVCGPIRGRMAVEVLEGSDFRLIHDKTEVQIAYTVT
jgi:hypothetical protein